MTLLHTMAAFIVALGVLIVVHEYGHYVVARLCGVKVLRFSVGFGRPLALWRRGADRTEWVIAAVPFGGYVKMLDEREGPVAPEESARAFNRQSVGRRFLIVRILWYGPDASAYFCMREMDGAGVAHIRGMPPVPVAVLHAGSAICTGRLRRANPQ